MALTQGTDYAFAPRVEVVMDKACLVCTRKFAYVVMEQVIVDRGWLTEVLRDDTLVESVAMDGQPIYARVGNLLAQPDTTLDVVHAFFEKLFDQWPKGVQIHDLERAKVIKAKPGPLCFPGSLLIKFEGNMGYTIIATGIPKPHNTEFPAFFAS